MPITKTASAGKSPFDVRVGKGFPHFRGMRTVSDAIGTPPNYWRYLQNVRLGMDGVQSRPGLGAFDAPGTIVNGMAEMDEEIQAATLYAGTYPRFARVVFYPTPPSEYQVMCYQRSDLSKIPSTYDSGFGYTTALTESSVGFIIGGRELGTGAAAADTWAKGPLSTACNSPYMRCLTVGWGSNGDVPGEGSNGLNFYQAPNCIDPVVLFNGKWLAAGQYRGDFDPGVGDYAPPYFTSPTGSPPPEAPAEGDITQGGQPIVEINFDTSKKLDRATLTGWDSDVLGAHVGGYGGGVTEVIRMPAPGYKYGSRTPNDIAPGFSETDHYPTGLHWIRSMVVVNERQDDTLTGAEGSGDVLYIGTAGGDVKIVGPYSGRDWGVNDPDIGDVYSFDGTTLKLETTGVGMLVCVAATPDGGILAAGAMSAKFKAEKDASWQTVTYSPTPTIPTSATPSLNEEYGYFWFDRIEYAGKIYLIGADRGAAIGSTTSRVLARPERLVIARFDPATLLITIIRRGDVFAQVSADNLAGGYYEDLAPGFSTTPPWALATDGGLLYYLNHWNVSAALRSYVGTYDGSVFTDDAYVCFDEVITDYVPVRNLLFAGGAIYVCNGTTWVWKIARGAISFLCRVGSYVAAKAFVGP